MTVLVVDDEPSEVERLRTILERSAYRVIAAFTGEEALHAARTRQPDLALIDTDLPDMPGLEVLRQIRLDPGTRPIGVILANPNPTDDEVIFGFRYVSDFHWRRPIEADDLLGVLARVGAGSDRIGPRQFTACWNEVWDAERNAS